MIFLPSWRNLVSGVAEANIDRHRMQMVTLDRWRIGVNPVVRAVVAMEIVKTPGSSISLSHTSVCIFKKKKDCIEKAAITAMAFGAN